MRERITARARAVVLVALAALLLAGCSSLGSTGDKGYIDGKGVITQLPRKDWKTTRPVQGTTLDGKKVALSDYRGKVVVVNVWGSWCPPCRAEAGLLGGVAKQLAPKGVQFLGIDVREPSKDNALAFERRIGTTYPSIYDPSGETLLSFHGVITPTSIPSTIVLDKQGRVRASILGQVTSRQTLIDLIQDAAK